jgi:ribonuclease HI
MEPYTASERALVLEHEKRILRIYQQITRRDTRVFNGFTKAYTGGACNLESLAVDGHQLVQSLTAEYFPDGSWKYSGERTGLLAAAVVYQNPEGKWERELAELGRFVGDSRDAELHAIWMALDPAQRHYLAGTPMKDVIVWTDSQRSVLMLEHRLTAKPEQLHLGPLPSDGKWALEKIYDTADFLQSCDVKVHVRWVAGKTPGGPLRADIQAKAANHKQFKRLGHLIPAPEIPGLYRQSIDIQREYLFRLSWLYFNTRPRIGENYCLYPQYNL